MTAIFINGLVSALLLLVMSFLPFFNIYVGGGILNIIILAVVIGVLTAFVGPFLKKFFHKANSLVQFIATLIVDAFVLILASWLPFGNLSIGWLSAVIAGAVLAAVGTAIPNVMSKR